MILFFAAYAAEVVRGGLQAIPRGQYEAADTIGLSYWQKTGRVILPQAMRIVLPALMNDIIRAFKNTTFVSIIGLFDVLRATSTALQDPLWVLFTIEAYLFIFLLYFVVCFTMSKYGEHLERDLAKGRNL
jgi:general L-amino acid transport system permease protein